MPSEPIAREPASPAASPAAPPAASLRQPLRPPPPPSWRALWRPILAMMLVVVSSNWLVQYPINPWLTWGAFVYPFAFLVNDLTNRAVGMAAARRVAWVGFGMAVIASLAVAPWRIAAASGIAFIVSQLADVRVFDRLRAQAWWKAPLLGSAAASVVDTILFFSIAFAGTTLDWWLLAIGDLGIKLIMAVALLGPYRAMLSHLEAWIPRQQPC
jgi:queuosine precursor transporter